MNYVVNVNPTYSTKVFSVAAVPVFYEKCVADRYMLNPSISYVSRSNAILATDRVAYKPFAQAARPAIALYAVTKLKHIFVRAQQQIGPKSFRGRLSPLTSRLVNRRRRPCRLRRKRKRTRRFRGFSPLFSLSISGFPSYYFSRYIVPKVLRHFSKSPSLYVIQ